MNGHAGRKQLEHVAQDAQFGIEYAFIAGLRCRDLKVFLVETMHATEIDAVPCSIG